MCLVIFCVFFSIYALLFPSRFQEKVNNNNNNCVNLTDPEDLPSVILYKTTNPVCLSLQCPQCAYHIVWHFPVLVSLVLHPCYRVTFVKTSSHCWFNHHLDSSPPGLVLHSDDHRHPWRLQEPFNGASLEVRLPTFPVKFAFAWIFVDVWARVVIILTCPACDLRLLAASLCSDRDKNRSLRYGQQWMATSLTIRCVSCRCHEKLIASEKVVRSEKLGGNQRNNSEIELILLIYRHGVCFVRLDGVECTRSTVWYSTIVRTRDTDKLCSNLCRTCMNRFWNRSLPLNAFPSCGFQ